MVLQNMGVAQKLILAFVTLILGAVLVGVIATNSLAVTQKTVQTETVNIAAAVLDGGTINESTTFTLNTIPAWRVDQTDCYPTSIVYKNQSGQTLTADTDYVFTSPSTLTLKDTLALNSTLGANNVTTAEYAYCQDGYLAQGWSRTITNLIAGFFALALLGASLGLFYSLAKDFDVF